MITRPSFLPLVVLSFIQGLAGSRLTLAVSLIGGLTVLACGDKETAGPGQNVQGTARVLNGPTPSSSSSPGAALGSVAATILGAGRTLEDTLWAVSPNQVQITLVDVVFDLGTRGHLSECVVTYDRSKPTLDTRLKCGFEVDAGSYIALAVEYKPALEVLIDNDNIGVYTDLNSLTLLSRIKPQGGAQFVPITDPRFEAAEVRGTPPTFFPEPLEIADGSTPTVDIVLHGLHTVLIDVGPSGATFDPSGEPVVIIAASGTGKAAYYNAVGTGLDVTTDARDFTRLVVLYDQTRPVYMSFLAFGTLGPLGIAGEPTAHATLFNPSLDLGLQSGGSLGLDASGTLCWALLDELAVETSGILMRMRELNNPGDTTWLGWEVVSSVPAPAEGNTYSDCSFITPTDSLPLTLIAN